MAKDNPNPRGWRDGNVFIDLHRVQSAYRNDDDDDGVLYVVFRSNGGHGTGSMQLGSTPIARMSDDAAKRFFDALEMYWSLR